MSTKIHMIKDNLNKVRDRVSFAAKSCNRLPSEITILAVSKGVSADMVVNAVTDGQTKFGENYVNEAVEKIQIVNKKLIELKKKIVVEWHFIGPIQSNKTKHIANYFDWVHSVDRPKIAEKLSVFREDHHRLLNVCIQVNTSGEKTKKGVSPTEASELASIIKGLPNLRLRGLMSIPTKTQDHSLVRRECKVLYNLGQELSEQGSVLDTLSLGMSSDLEIAISEGSTIIRVGTAIFGPRAR